MSTPNPCPFCGSDKIEADFGDESACYRCRNCGVQSGRVYFTEAEKEADHFVQSEADALEAWNRRALPAAPAQAPAAERQSAKERFSACWDEADGNDPVERLRAFCSFAMSGQDWLDVEPFFDALATTPAPQAVPASSAPAEQGGQPMPDWWEPIPEDAAERRMFDSNLHALYGGDPRVPIVQTLTLWGRAQKGGSYEQMCYVLANEVAKLHITAPPAAQPAEPVTRQTMLGYFRPPECSYPMGEGWAVEVSRWGERILTIEHQALCGKSELTDEDQRVILGCAERLSSFVGGGLAEAGTARLDHRSGPQDEHPSQPAEPQRVLTEDEINQVAAANEVFQYHPGALLEFARDIEAFCRKAWGIPAPTGAAPEAG